MNFDSQGFMGGLGGILGGLFGDSGKPYDKAMDEYQKWATQGQGAQQPFLDAGTGAIKQYQDWLNGQKDPSKFINDQMKNYKTSDYAQNMQQQAMNAGENYGSANGLMGSTPLMQQMQQNAGTITSADQNQWLQNVLGINTQYGQGQNNLVNTGANSANKLTDMYSHMGDKMGDAAYGKEQSKHNDFWGALGGLGGLIGSFF